jgi:hypothetical protein
MLRKLSFLRLAVPHVYLLHTKHTKNTKSELSSEPFTEFHHNMTNQIHFFKNHSFGVSS